MRPTPDPTSLSPAAREFVHRAIQDAAHELASLSGYRKTSADIGETVTEGNSMLTVHADQLQALDVAMLLLGLPPRGQTRPLDEPAGLLLGETDGPARAALDTWQHKRAECQSVRQRMLQKERVSRQLG